MDEVAIGSEEVVPLVVQQLSRPQARGMIAAAVMAPSSHNTQPWRFGVAEDHVLVMADRSRRLPVNDPDDRELVISCGTAAFTLALAARHLGLVTSVQTLLDDEEPDVLCRVGFTPTDDTASGVEDLYRAIDERHTSRASFTDDPVPDRLVDALTEAAADHGAWLDVVEESRRQPVAALVAEGARAQFADPQWRRELASWMRPRRSGEGLAVRGLLAPIVRTVVAHLNLGRRTARADHDLATAAPVLAVLGTEHDRVEDWLAAGEALQHVLLVAAGQGVQAGFLNQPCQVSELRPRLRALLDRTGHPQVVLRLGHPAKPLPAAPRRPVDALIDPPRG